MVYTTPLFSAAQFDSLSHSELVPGSGIWTGNGPGLFGSSGAWLVGAMVVWNMGRVYQGGSIRCN